ncbi:hypothetical protein NKI94_32085 [Mesorhizobium australicum]|uniref:hypothetical protein n=1 Tax=Mesorhizobium australicum TaxID=536018 RepID=UPI003337A9ED
MKIELLRRLCAKLKKVLADQMLEASALRASLCQKNGSARRQARSRRVNSSLGCRRP